MVCSPLSNAHISGLLATLLGLHVGWVAAEMQLRCAQSRPQRDCTVLVSAQHDCQLPPQVATASTVHVFHEPCAGQAVSLLSFRLVRTGVLDITSALSMEYSASSMKYTSYFMGNRVLFM